MPKKLEECIEKLISEGKTEQEAWAICQSMANDSLTIDKGFTDYTKYIDERTGFMHIKGTVARDGIQEYLGLELGAEEPTRMYNVLRPTEEVLKKESLDTFLKAPVTDNHPSHFVEVSKDKAHQSLVKGVSVSYDTLQDENGINRIVCELIIKDESLIQKIQDGKVEISAGYSQNLIKEDGEFNGVPYQYKQTDIKINHIAIVGEGRCGGICRIITDSKAVIIDDVKSKKGRDMPNITIDGVQHEITDCIAKHISDMTKRIKSLDEDMEKLQAEKDVLEEEAAKEKTADINAPEIVAEISERVKMLAELLSEGVQAEPTESVTDMKRKYIATKSKIALDGKSDAYVEAAFDMLKAENIKKSQDNAARSFVSKATDGATVDSAYAKYKASLVDAHKK